jgi:putative transposase
MPNHVHLIAVPDAADSLRRAIGEAHRRYTWHINHREGWRGHLWQGRFASFAMDGSHLLASARYIELNPVRAGLVATPGEYRWSSAPAHLAGRDDDLVQVDPLLALVPRWDAHLGETAPLESLEMFRRHERTGRPLGDDEFVADLEDSLGRALRPQRPGPKPGSASGN